MFCVTAARGRRVDLRDIERWRQAARKRAVYWQAANGCFCIMAIGLSSRAAAAFPSRAVLPWVLALAALGLLCEAAPLFEERALRQLENRIHAKLRQAVVNALGESLAEDPPQPPWARMFAWSMAFISPRE